MRSFGRQNSRCRTRARRPLVWALLALLFSTVANAQKESSTGSRVWTLVDGSQARMQFLKFDEKRSLVEFRTKRHLGSTKRIPLSKFSDSDQAFIRKLTDGTISLIQIPGLSTAPDFPNGERKDRGTSSHFTVGPEREWTNTGGRTITARLINLTDLDASLLVDNKVVRVPLTDLSSASQSHLKDVRAGKVLFAPEWIGLGSYSWGAQNGYAVHFPGEELYQTQDIDTSFETALQRSLTTVKEKLGDTGWTLTSFTAVDSLNGKEKALNQRWPSWVETFPPLPKQLPFHFVAEFSIEQKRAREVRAIWQPNTSASSWRGLPVLRLHFSPSGEPAYIH